MIFLYINKLTHVFIPSFTKIISKKKAMIVGSVSVRIVGILVKIYAITQFTNEIHIKITRHEDSG